MISTWCSCGIDESTDVRSNGPSGPSWKRIRPATAADRRSISVPGIDATRRCASRAMPKLRRKQATTRSSFASL